MKSLVDVARQLALLPEEALDPDVPARAEFDQTTGLDLTTGSAGIASLDLPLALRERFAQSAAARARYADAAWPQRGQILRLESRNPQSGERPFAALLLQPAGQANVWDALSVAPASEMAWAGDADATLTDTDGLCDPQASIVQCWNRLRVPVTAATACLGWLDAARVREFETMPLPTDTHDEAVSTYRQLYSAAALNWSQLAGQLATATTVSGGLLDRLRAQLGELAGRTHIGEVGLLLPQAMGESEPVLWRLGGVVIRFQADRCVASLETEAGMNTGLALYLDDLLLEQHSLTQRDQTLVIPLPEQPTGQMILRLVPPTGGAVDLVV